MDFKPCHKCEKRVLNCHKTCIAYLKTDFMNKHKNQVKRAEYDFNDYKIKRVVCEKRRANRL